MKPLNEIRLQWNKMINEEYKRNKAIKQGKKFKLPTQSQFPTRIKTLTE